MKTKSQRPSEAAAPHNPGAAPDGNRALRAYRTVSFQALGDIEVTATIQTLRALLLILLIVPRSATAVAEANASFDSQALELAWNRAHLEADTPALDALWADDISIVVPGMAPLGKAEALKMWKAVPVKFTQYESEGLSARVEGTTAVVTGSIARARTFGDRSAKEKWYFTKVYRLSGNAWRVIAFHASNAPDSISP